MGGSVGFYSGNVMELLEDVVVSQTPVTRRSNAQPGWLSPTPRLALGEDRASACAAAHVFAQHSRPQTPAFPRLNIE
jgi:hypothetical protein